MSRIGRQPIPVPSGVELTLEPELVRVKGPKGELQERVSRDIKIEQQDGQILVSRPSDRRDHRALHGLTRTLVANMVQGVTAGFEKGWRSRASATGPRSEATTSSFQSGTRTKSR